MGKSVHVVILAGGYSTEIARGAAAAAEAAGSASKLTGALAAAAAMGPVVVPALLPLDGTPALVRLLKAFQAVRRVNLAAVWVVHNDGDAAQIKGPGGLFGTSPASDLGLPAVNFLPNGSSGPGSWSGEAADFRTALAAIAASGPLGDACVAALSATLAFMPNYNLQRLLEHSYLRGRDVCGFSMLNGVDLALLGGQGHVEVVPGEDSALPRIERLQPLTAPSPGAKVAEPYLFLRPETVASVSRGGGGGGLQGLAGGLVAAGTYVAGIDLMFGRYNLRTSEAVDYADRFFAFCAAAATDPSKVGLKPDAVLQPYNTSPGGATGGLPPVPAAGSFIGRSTAAHFRFDEADGMAAAKAAESSLHGTDYEAFSRTASAFNGRFFGDATSSAKATAAGMKHYLLPHTFYMTAYRRQGADIML